MQAEEFRRVGTALVAAIAKRLAGIPDGPVTPGERPGAVRSRLDAERTLPGAGSDAEALVSNATELLFEHSLFNGHPRFFGYITSSPTPWSATCTCCARAL